MIVVFVVLATIVGSVGQLACCIRISVFAQPLARFCARSLADSVVALEAAVEAVVIAGSDMDLCSVEGPQNMTGDAEAADMCRFCG